MSQGLERQIADYLAAQGLGTVGTDIHTLEEPDTPAQVLTVFLDAGGAPPERQIGEEQAITVRSRSASAETAHQRARQVHDLLHWFQGQLVAGGTVIVRIQADSQPMQLGRDLTGGRLWRTTQTFSVLSRRVTFS